MRVLLTSHFSLSQFGSGVQARDLAVGLLAAGHEVHCLSVSNVPEQGFSFPVRTIVCSPDISDADLTFPVPDFYRRGQSSFLFGDLSDEQLSRYREVFRQRLDEEVDRFNPHVIHGQHIGVQGELILETGVPYVLTAHAAELCSLSEDARLEPLAIQAAENAGRILVGSEQLRTRLLSRFTDVAERTVVVPAPIDVNSTAINLAATSQSSSKSLVETAQRSVLFVGDCASPEDAEVFLNAVERLSATGEPLAVTMRGDAEQIRLWRIQVEQLGLTEINFSPVAPNAEIVVPSVATLLVIPSADEISESLALRAGVAEISVLRKNDAFSDHEKLADAVQQSLHEARRFSAHASLAKRIISKYSLAAVIPEVVRQYEAVLIDRFGKLPAH